MSKKRDLEIYRAQLQQYYRQGWYTTQQHPKPAQFRFQTKVLGNVVSLNNEDIPFVALVFEVERVRGKVSTEDISLSFEYECSRDCCDGDGSMRVSVQATEKEEDPLWEAKMKIWTEEWELAPETRAKIKTEGEQERVKQLRKELATLEAKLKK